ncbi:MAG TPA: single-stranded DNA-binding protein [Polyangiaceae bacterium]|jgi:single-strand DNA-binding protein|nr:single-stranded DNA-binding protein [Polyangiaceae bacterium]
MADGLNRVMLLGNLGADPELRMTPSGQAVLKLRLATSESYLDRNKVRQEKTEWHNVVIWGKRAEGLAKILSKGSRLFIEGGLRTSSYDDRDGNKRYRTEVVANNIILAGSAGRGGGGPRPVEGGGGHDEPEPAPAAGGGGGFDDLDYGGGGSDDDIPF